MYLLRVSATLHDMITDKNQKKKNSVHKILHRIKHIYSLKQLGVFLSYGTVQDFSVSLEKHSIFPCTYKVSSIDDSFK